MRNLTLAEPVKIDRIFCHWLSPISHCCVHANQQLVPVPSKINQLHTLAPHSSIPILIFFPYLRVLFIAGLFNSSFPAASLSVFIITHTRSKCPTHLILTDTIYQSKVIKPAQVTYTDIVKIICITPHRIDHGWRLEIAPSSNETMIQSLCVLW